MASTYGLVREKGSKEYKRNMSGGDIIKADLTSSVKNSLNSIKGTAITKDKNGNVTATVGDLFKGDTWRGLGKKIGEELKEATSWKGIGKSIADSFKKTLDEGAAGLGIDKAVKGATEIFNSMKMKKPDPKGDDLVKAQGEKRESEAKASAKRDEEIINQLKGLRDDLKGKGSGGSGGSTT